MLNGQVEVTDEIRKIAAEIKSAGKKEIIALRRLLFAKVKQMDLDEEDELRIRWRRTATEILRDGYVYKHKGCSDMCVAYIALARARGLDAKYERLYWPEKKAVHAVIEAPLGVNATSLICSQNSWKRTQDSR